jgi:hypothetical protein
MLSAACRSPGTGHLAADCVRRWYWWRRAQSQAPTSAVVWTERWTDRCQGHAAGRRAEGRHQAPLEAGRQNGGQTDAKGMQLGVGLRRPPSGATGTGRIQMVLFCMQNRTSGPYSAAIHRILISVMAPLEVDGWPLHGFVPLGFRVLGFWVWDTVGIQLVLFGTQNRISGRCLAWPTHH